ncbi:hypothetical protein Ocin01_00739 [Orchesella cincta]|uniref:Uncharacterized protein n=1 Tax=Orchesella cincta TaxID=48709 RepID=A0A1D2NKZ7_ORCCI|nr:hypothetical protein Ocin01_00739 [Orchesella cincta]
MRIPYFSICVFLWFGSDVLVQAEEPQPDQKGEADNSHTADQSGKFGFSFQLGEVDEPSGWGGGWDPVPQHQPKGWGGWEPEKPKGWGWEAPKVKGWGWQPEKPKGWGWEQPKGWHAPKGWRPPKKGRRHRRRRPKKGWGRRPKKGKGGLRFIPPSIKLLRPKIKISPPRLIFKGPKLRFVKG